MTFVIVRSNNSNNYQNNLSHQSSNFMQRYFSKPYLSLVAHSLPSIKYRARVVPHPSFVSIYKCFSHKSVMSEIVNSDSSTDPAINPNAPTFFDKLVRKEIPARIAYEDDLCLGMSSSTSSSLSPFCTNYFSSIRQI